MRRAGRPHEWASVAAVVTALFILSARSASPPTATRRCCYGCALEAGGFALDGDDQATPYPAARSVAECAQRCHLLTWCFEFEFSPPVTARTRLSPGAASGKTKRNSSCLLFRPLHLCTGRQRGVQPTAGVFRNRTSMPVVGVCGSHVVEQRSATNDTTKLVNSTAGLCAAGVWPTQCAVRLQPVSLNEACGHLTPPRTAAVIAHDHSVTPDRAPLAPQKDSLGKVDWTKPHDQPWCESTATATAGYHNHTACAAVPAFDAAKAGGCLTGKWLVVLGASKERAHANALFRMLVPDFRERYDSSYLMPDRTSEVGLIYQDFVLSSTGVLLSARVGARGRGRYEHLPLMLPDYPKAPLLNSVDAARLAILHDGESADTCCWYRPATLTLLCFFTHSRLKLRA